MGASVSRLHAHLPSMPRFSSPSSTSTSTSTSTSPVSFLINRNSDDHPRTRAHHDIPPVSASIHQAEASMIHHLISSSFAYDKRCIPITLPSSSSPTTTIYINILSAGPVHCPHIFLLSGWGGGAAFYARNLPGLCKHFRVHVVDWPGFGASSRPPYDINGNVHKSEAYFLDVLEHLLFHQFQQYEPSFTVDKQTNLNIIAHSLGAYLSVAFALKHKQSISTLILISPIGIPERPKPQPTTTTTTSSSNSNNNCNSSSCSSFKKMKKKKQPSLLKRLLFQLIFLLWDLGFTPQLLMRLVPKFVGIYLSKQIVSSRFVVENDGDATNAIINYFYQISCAPCAAELSLSTILESGAYAKHPLCNRIQHLHVPNVVFVYGDRDWNNVDAGRQACTTINETNANINTNVIIAPHAGHHLYFDNYHFFNQVVIDSCSS